MNLSLLRNHQFTARASSPPVLAVMAFIFRSTSLARTILHPSFLFLIPIFNTEPPSLAGLFSSRRHSSPPLFPCLSNRLSPSPPRITRPLQWLRLLNQQLLLLLSRLHPWITSRIYDATAIGEPMAMGKDKKKVWEKLMNARVVYLGEAEQVSTKDDKELELEIVKNLRKRCDESERQISVALDAFPLDLQDQLSQYMDKRMDGDTLKSFVTHWPAQRWQEYEPLLSYCRDNAIRLIACGTPLKQELL